MGLPQRKLKRTPEEYLAIERAATQRSEFFDGEMFAMSGGSLVHSLIAVNLSRELSSALEGAPCKVFESNLRLLVRATGLYTYSDGGVFCGPPEFDDDRRDTILNPTLVIEVLSPSTEAYDRGKKFGHYRRIPTLREYLLVSQDEPRLELFVRQADGLWKLEQDKVGLDESVGLSSIGVKLSLSRVYLNVDFGSAAEAVG
jgi:Uma2 family endonuclease